MLGTIKNKIRFSVAVLIFLPLVLALACGSADEPAPSKDQLALVWEAWEKIDQSYAGWENVDPDQVESSAGWSLFLYTEDRQGKRQEFHVSEDVGRWGLVDLPTALLVNEGTAAEAEAVAAVLQESGRAVLMGTDTFGMAGNYDFVELEDGSAIYLAGKL